MDLTSVVERTKSMEQRLGISIQGVYANLEGDYITVNFEINVDGGGKLAQDIVVVVVVYDAAGRVIDTASDYLIAEKVLGSRVESMTLSVPNQRITKIRVYPQIA
jgi:hypothetical protein